MEEQVRMYQNQLELMQDSQEKVRSFRHDMQRSLRLLYAMAEKGQWEKILHFLEDMQTSLENAIEAVAKTIEPYVALRLLAQKNTLSLQVKNSYDGVLKRRGNQFISTKAGNGHGVGLTNVGNLVEQKQGSFQVNYNQKEFRVDCVSCTGIQRYKSIRP